MTSVEHALAKVLKFGLDGLLFTQAGDHLETDRLELVLLHCHAHLRSV